MKKRPARGDGLWQAVHGTRELRISQGPWSLKNMMAAASLVLPCKKAITQARDEASFRGELSFASPRHQDVSAARGAAKRKAEAEDWIKSVRARKPSTGIPVKSGLREGQRVK